ncbi:DUF2634 domain-containing protein [Pelotomaculum propionicicum]|uniref:IraD/Gp25-like domain-containing protein n=1 Tax=Pelotomaculum propionicicum TaxID=258475 RepID=A0A4Y7RJW3_9FIRM|nr:DUF2634 domain-containing protein [Pelotomaculum propionicicum]TEB09133.1 hypothetical protein Pmgp_03354 [Pelotomaculum propionicicum]
MLEDILLDDDGNFLPAADGDAATVKNADCLLQDVKHRLLTYPGDLWSHPEYGVGLQRYHQAEDTEINRLELKQLIKMRLSDDERINLSSLTVSINSWTRDAISIEVSFIPASTAFNEKAAKSQATIILTITQDGISFSGGSGS